MTIPNTNQSDCRQTTWLNEFFGDEPNKHVIWLDSLRRDLQAECDYYDLYADRDGEARQRQLRGLIKDIEMTIYTQPERAEELRYDLMSDPGAVEARYSNDED